MNKTKKGAASIYVVVFVTLLLGVITVGFVRVILREARNTTEDELSESARDSALTGIEDAKRAIKKYYQCIADPKGAGCDVASNFQMTDCNFVGGILGKITAGETDQSKNEVLIQTLDTGDSHTEQAYTCVTVSDESEDYLGKLTPDQTVVVIPLRAGNMGEIQKIEFNWYSKNNVSAFNFSTKDNYPVKDTSNLPTPPVISFQYIGEKSGGGYETDTLFLNPNDSINNAVDFIAGRTTSKPTLVKCDGDSYKCSYTAKIINSTTPRFLVVSLPYGTPETDFQVKMKKVDNSIVSFVGVQLIVDSTGRANDMFARIETRLMNADPNFPYPQFALQIGDGGITKDFWATKNCKKIDNGSVTNCNNSGNR